MSDCNDRVMPLSDMAFSRMYRDMGGAPSMKELINAVLVSAGDEPIDEIIRMKSQYSLFTDDSKGKNGRLDVMAKTRGGEIVDTEVQLELKGFSVEREMFYGDKAHWGGLGRGKPYKDAAKTRVISLLNFVLRKESPEIVQPIKLMYTTDPVVAATDAFRIYHVEIPKFTALYRTLEDISGEKERNTPLIQWLYILTKGYQNEDEMRILAERNIGMDNFFDIYSRANADPEFVARYKYRMSAERDEASRLADAKEEGHAEGVKEGISLGEESNAKKTAAKLLKTGMPIKDVADFVEYPLEQVKGWLGIP